MAKLSRFQERVALKTVEAEDLAAEVSADPSLVEFAFEGLRSPRASLKYKYLKVLNLLARQRPEALYPYFSRFAAYLDDDNNIFKWNAQDILANLAGVDRAGKFVPLIEKYYGMMCQGNLITAAHSVENSALIIKAQPRQEGKITRWLCEVDSLDLPTAECHNILAGKVINTFDLYFTQSKSQPAMLDFARRHLDDSRPATRRKAAQFLKKRSPARV